MGDVFRREGRAVGEGDVLPEEEDDGAAIVLDLVRGGQLGLDLLGGAVDPKEDPAGQVADGLRRVVIGKGGVEAAGLAVEAEAQLAAPLTAQSRCGQQQEEKGPPETHTRYSSAGTSKWQHATMRTRRAAGARTAGWLGMAETFSSSRSSPPREGRGSGTPRPRSPRLAS